MLTFRSLAHYMAMRDVLLLLRAPFLHASSSGVADYKIESDQYWALIPPPLPQLGEASTSALADPRMVLVKLVDRDDILADTSAVVQAPSHAAASSSGGIGDSECGGGQGVSAEDDGVAADAEIQEDIEQYLEDSLHASLGNPDLFNPMIYTSNTINNLVCTVYDWTLFAIYCIYFVLISNFSSTSSTVDSLCLKLPTVVHLEPPHRLALTHPFPPCQHLLV